VYGNNAYIIYLRLLFYCFTDPEEVKEALGALDLASRELIFIPINNNSDVSKAGGSHWYVIR
jgi:hypothetical protein